MIKLVQKLLKLLIFGKKKIIPTYHNKLISLLLLTVFLHCGFYITINLQPTKKLKSDYKKVKSNSLG